MNDKMTIAPASELPLFRQRRAVTTVPARQHDVEADGRDVLRTLRQFAAVGQRWTKARELVAALGWGEFNESTRRRVTAAVEELGWRVIGLKAQGYCATEAASIEEITHWDRQQDSQIKRMTEKLIAVRNFRHKGDQGEQAA